jgi:membrane protein YqaA with SNARE-associated domain
MEFVKIFLVVLAVNLIPAFGPPTWSILVLYRLHSYTPVIPLVLVGAIAAALGRFGLAYAFRLFGGYLPAATTRNLAAARVAIERNRWNYILGLALFALSPIPSAQLFEAAGLAQVRLLGFTAAFFVGRVISYSIYVLTIRKLQQSSIGDEMEKVITSPFAILVEIIMIAALIGFTQVNWRKFINNRINHVKT